MQRTSFPQPVPLNESAPLLPHRPRKLSAACSPCIAGRSSSQRLVPSPNPLWLMPAEPSHLNSNVALNPLPSIIYLFPVTVLKKYMLVYF